MANSSKAEQASKMPAQKPGRSKQDYGTPPAFLEAVRRLLHIEQFAIDLAASAANAVCPHFYTEEDDSLMQSWVVDGWGWCNPPFARLAPWVEKAYYESQMGAQVAMLVPAGVGSNWWRDWVHRKAMVHLLNGRLTFVGEKQPYPKDCALLIYATHVDPTYLVWDWRP